jgi:hypothetical protein
MLFLERDDLQSTFQRHVISEIIVLTPKPVELEL